MNIIKKTSIVMVLLGTFLAFSLFGNNALAEETGGEYYSLLADGYTVCEIQSIESDDSEYLSVVPAKETTNHQYWFSNYFDFEAVHHEMDSLCCINLFTVDTRGGITGITQKTMEMFSWY